MIITNYDLDGSVMAVSNTTAITEGVNVVVYAEPDAMPSEIALNIGDTAIEMVYSEEVATMLGRLNEVSALDFLQVLQRNLWGIGGIA